MAAYAAREDDMRRLGDSFIFGCVLAAAVIATPAFGLGAPDGQPPSRETVCNGLSGAAFGLCNAYCEAQDCDVHPRPSCAQLRKNFLKKTGSPIFPCDRLPCELSGAPACGGTCPDGKDCTAVMDTSGISPQDAMEKKCECVKKDP